jgi:hypothetical protein
MSERRHSPRVAHRAPVRFFIDGDLDAEFQLDSCDVGRSGLFVTTELLPSPGDRLAFSLEWAGRAVSGWGRVVRVAADPAPGFGLVFEQLSA